MSTSIVSPFPVFNDLDGTPLENGYVYIGESNLNPETAPLNVYWDAELTVPAAQPIRTIGGYLSRNGSPSQVYVSANSYSITVRNVRKVFVFSDSNALNIPSIFPGDSVSFTPAGTGAVTTTIQNKAREIVSVKDFGALGDGIHDDTQAVQYGIDFINSIGGGELHFPAGKYSIKSAKITLKDKVQLVGAGSQCTTLDFSEQSSWASSEGFIKIQGTGLGTLKTVGVDSQEGQSTISVASSGFSDGDVIQLRSTEFYEGRPQAVYSVYPWAASTGYGAGTIINVNGNWYVCVVSGIAGSTAPTATTNPVPADGNVTWYYINLTSSYYQTPWVANQSVTVGKIKVNSNGKIYFCVTAGTTGSTQPTASDQTGLIVDGTVNWRYISRYQSRKAEFTLVQHVSSSTVDLSQPLRMGYPLAGDSSYSVQAAKVTFAKASVSGFTINGKGNPPDLNQQSAPPRYFFTGSSADIGIDAIWASLDLHDLTFTNIEQIGVKLQSCYDCSISKFRIINNSKNIEGQQYGIWAARCTTSLRISDYYGKNSRHVMTTDGGSDLSPDYIAGVPCDIVMINGTGDGIWQSAVDTHAGAIDVVANGGVFNTLSAGVKFRSKRTSVSNFLINSVSDLSGYSDGGFSVYYDGGEMVLSNIEVRNGYYGFRFSDVSSSGMGKIVASNLLSTNSQLAGMYFGTSYSEMFGSVNLSNITISNPIRTSDDPDTPGDCIYINGMYDQFLINGLTTYKGDTGVRTASTASFDEFALSNFNLLSSNYEALYLENLTNFAVSNGVLQRNNVTGTQFRLRNCKNGSVSNVIIPLLASSSAAIGVYLNATTAGGTKNVSIDNVQVIMPSGTAQGVNVDTNSENCTIGPSCDLRTCSTRIVWDGKTGMRGGYLTGSKTFDPASIASGANVTTTITVTGTDIGDAVVPTFSLNLQAITLTAYVSAANTVTVVFQNGTAGAIDLASGMLKVVAFKIG